MRSSRNFKFERRKHFHSIKQPLINLDLKYFMIQMKLRYLKSILQSRSSLLLSYCSYWHHNKWGIFSTQIRLRPTVWAGAVRAKAAKTQKKSKTWRTDQRTKRGVEPWACAEKKWKTCQVSEDTRDDDLKRSYPDEVLQKRLFLTFSICSSNPL